MKKIIIYLPVSNLYPYYRTLCSIAKTLSDDVYILQCKEDSYFFNIFSDLNTMNDKVIFYKQYKRVSNSAKKAYSLKIINIEEYISEKDIKQLSTLIPNEINEMQKFEYKGYKIGKASECDLILKTKILNIENISNEEKNIYFNYILNAIVSAELTDKLCKIIKPDLFLAFNPYTINQVSCFFAKKNNVDFEYITNNTYKGSDYSSFLFSKTNIDEDIFNLIRKYPEHCEYPLIKNFVSNSWEDTFFRLYGEDDHIFSTSKSKRIEDILSYLKLQKKKTIVAFTSSNDEILASQLNYETQEKSFPLKNIFQTQVEWINYLKKYASKHNDIQIIIRVHPREGIKQNGKLSEHLIFLQKAFTERTENFVIVWADDPISSYDLIELADLCLVNWSSMGLECARIGIPVLSYTSGAYYIESKSIYVANSFDDYEKKLNNLLNKEYSFEMLADGIRYDFWRNHVNVIDCSDTITHDFNDDTFWPYISKAKSEVINKIISGETTAIEYNKTIWLNSINDNTLNEERKAILRGISSFYYKVIYEIRQNKLKKIFLRLLRKFIYLISIKKININITPEKMSEENIKNMIYSKKFALIKSYFTKNPYYKLINENMILYYYKGKKYIRYSPLLYKLGILYKDNYKKN